MGEILKLYKYCKAEHNPLKGGDKLRLGTTIKFSKNYEGEGDFINDKEEGLTTGGLAILFSS